MVAEPSIVDLRSAVDRMRPTTIPSATPDFALLRLHLDRATKATVSLVAFPAGWSRPDLGYFSCAEEFVMIEGDLAVSGVRYGPGDYAYLPAGLPRTDSRSDAGCLTVAWFSGPPRWHFGALDGEPPTAVRMPLAGARRPGGGAYGSPDAPKGPVTVDTDVFWLGAHRWCFAPAGAPLPAIPGGPVLIRHWPRSTKTGPTTD